MTRVSSAVPVVGRPIALATDLRYGTVSLREFKGKGLSLGFSAALLTEVGGAESARGGRADESCADATWPAADIPRPILSPLALAV
jgi:hypothetical protein